jgi:hypothetical protein
VPTRRNRVIAGEGYYKPFISAPLSGIGSTYFDSIKYIYYRKRKYILGKALVPRFVELTYNGRIVLEDTTKLELEFNPLAKYIVTQLELQNKPHPMIPNTLKAHYLIENKCSSGSYTKILEWIKNTPETNNTYYLEMERISNNIPPEVVAQVENIDPLTGEKMSWADIVEGDNFSQEITKEEEQHITEINQMNAKLPPLIDALLEHEFREIRQLAYRFATTPANSEGVRVVHIYFNVMDDGKLNPLVHAFPRNHPIAQDSRERTRRMLHPIGNSVVELSHDAILDTLAYSKFYKDEIERIKKNFPGVIKVVGENYYKFDDPKIKNMGREIEEGPIEYKNHPFYTDVDLQKIPVQWDTRIPMCPTQNDNRKINTNIIPEGHYWRKIEKDGRKTRERMTGHAYGESTIPYTVLRLSIAIKLPEWKLTPQQAITQRPPTIETKDIAPVYIAFEQEEEIITTSICKNSHKHKKLNFTDLFHLSKKEREKITFRQDCHRRMVKCFTNTLDAVITVLCIARQVQCADKPFDEMIKQKGIRTFDTSKNNERFQLFYIRQICNYYINLFNQTNFNDTNEIQDKHDFFIKIAKEMSSQIRVIWQKAMTREREETTGIMSLFKFNDLVQNRIELNGLSKLVIKFLTYTNPQYLNDNTIVRFEGDEYSLPTYGLCSIGYLGRALPLCSLKKIDQENLNTYERFREPKTPHAWDKRLKEDVRIWAKEFFAEVPNRCRPNGRPYMPKIGASASWERSRSSGGYTSYLSDVFKSLRPLTKEQFEKLKLPKTWEFFEKNRVLIDQALQVGNLSKKSDLNANFAYAYGLDMLEDYIEHAKDCKREDCTELEKHLPMYTIGIRELGGKARVPCITTGLLNTITEPIRQKMFIAIKKDKRCTFRLKNVDKVEMIETFLRKMEKADTIHSGDLTVSTDNFPLWFMKSVGQGMFDAGVINQQEFNILLLCSGPFAMIKPTEENEDLRKHIKPLPRNTLIDKYKQLKLDKMNENSIALKMLKGGLNKKTKREVNINIPEQIRFENGKEVIYPEVKYTTEYDFFRYNPNNIITEEMIDKKLFGCATPILRGARDKPIPLTDEIHHPTEHVKWGMKPKPAGPLIRNKNAYDRPEDNTTVPTFIEWYDEFRPKGYYDTQHQKYINGIKESWRPTKGATRCKACGTDLITFEMHKSDDCNMAAYKLYMDLTKIRIADGKSPYYRTKTTEKVVCGLVTPRDTFMNLLEGGSNARPEDRKEEMEELYYKNRKFQYAPSDQYDMIEDINYFKIAKHYIKRTKQSWNVKIMQFEDVYLTRKGVQMSTSISIGMLYSYNLFADDQSFKLSPTAKGQSLLCGDDSLRTGNESFIEGYRQTITALGGIWSETKDVVGRYPRGVFTELYIENGQIIKVPKAKTVIRPDKEDKFEAPSWRRALPAINSLKAPQNCKGPLVREIMEKFPQLTKEYVPTFLPKELGGLGIYSPGRNDVMKKTWDNIKRIKDPMIASECLRGFRKCISIEKHTTERHLLDIKEIIKDNPPTYMRGPKELLDMQYKLGLSSYAYLETQRLRGLIEAATILEDPPMPVPFRNDTGQVALRCKESINDCYDLMVKYDVDDYSGTHRKDTLYDIIPTDKQYIMQTYKVDVATTWVETIADAEPLTPPEGGSLSQE